MVTKDWREGLGVAHFLGGVAGAMLPILGYRLGPGGQRIEEQRNIVLISSLNLWPKYKGLYSIAHTSV